MNISYKSTRSDKTITASQAILKGISDEGGLFVPTAFPQIDLENLVHKSYKEICYSILSKYLPEFSENHLKDIIGKAYDKFSVPKVAPVVSFGNRHILELFHGPTLAFKDVALSILPYLIQVSAKLQNVEDKIVILTATSGDTGKAALEGFANVENTKIIVFYPSEGVSSIQKRQMTSQVGNNVYVLGIEGNFDDAQNGVKSIFSNKEFKEKLKSEKIILSSANSINIGRLLPQVVYYFSSYMELVQKGAIALNDSVNFTVPTGNFGDILAGYYAKKMGLPIHKLLCASNSNNVLYDFFKTGTYNKNREFIKTISPSMDILISSNFERMLYHASNNDQELIVNLMEELNTKGSYTIPEEMKSGISELFYGSYSDEESTKKVIGQVYEEYNYVLDPHTAVAYKVCEDYVKNTSDERTNIILSTASPFKFPEAVYESIFKNSDLEVYELIDKLAQKTSLTIPEPIKKLKDSAILHKKVISSDEMKEAVGEILL
ncbi:threonine synthase [Alkalibaculum bacchi]|uniref:Threonine synthase n=1 Tax=Alkalibaculum bacchi TaxID=645887 RepID=A0A366IDH1_9FIRM|nr:threonine synthase [Alkalibaculum bacchi]RBP68988.1 threonine synthase [Alkalibaculum bacchi]